MSDKAPRKKHVASEDDDNNMDGATSPTTRPTCSCKVSEGLLWSLWYVWTRMKILSTPTAKTRKGMISKMIKVAETPMNPKMPMEAATDSNTIITPPNPKVIWRVIRSRDWKLIRNNYSYSILYIIGHSVLSNSHQKNANLSNRKVH